MLHGKESWHREEHRLTPYLKKTWEVFLLILWFFLWFVGPTLLVSLIGYRFYPH